MKFSHDKKSSLFIYANDVIKGSDDKMENALKKELEATKSALKLQTIRCRQLVAAFTRKLHEKELELRASKDLRDQQLSRLLRALLILESRLKKEQKLIRQQLQEKDIIIEQQEKEISKFKFDTAKKWSNADSGEDQKREESWSLPESKPSFTTGEERLDNLCKGLLNNSPLYRPEVGSELDKNNEIQNMDSAKKEEATFRDNPVLESVNQILLRDEEELLKSPQPVTIGLSEKVMFNSVEDSTEWYETNSNTVPEEQTSSGAWCIKVEEAEEEPEFKSKKDTSWSGEKTSPIKSQHMEEKACLEMSKKNLTVVNLEEIDSNSAPNTDRAGSPAKSTASYEEIIPVTKNPNYKPVRNLQKPPALPPKPARLLKPHQILQQKNKQQPPAPQKDATNQQAPSQSSPEQAAPRPSQNLPVNTKATQPIPKKQAPSSFSQPATNTRHRHPDLKPEPAEAAKPRPKPSDSSSRPKKSQINGHVPGSLDSVDCVIPSQFARQKKKEEPNANCGAIKIGSSVSSLITGLSRETIVTELGGESVPTADDSHVSQLVRQFEVLGKLGMLDPDRSEDEANDIRKNFEEFKLEESYVDSVIEPEENGRHDGDGAENRNMVNYYATLTIVPPPLPKEPPPGAELEYKMYETFLENTGLSQKSILTPSRMLSNHRSCLKPKDVKHRNRVKAAAAIEKCNVNTTNGGSTVKYWTEPFL